MSQELYHRQSEFLDPPAVDIIDVSKLDLSDDERWLFESTESNIVNLREWLYCEEHLSNCGDRKIEPTKKNIDTRTFTRPKKRFTRPSIGELCGNIDDSFAQMRSEDDVREPLHFDLSQQDPTCYFDVLAKNASMIDSFQNMSPPSLVNSMCSSTFATLMESSFIKNDPVLREIRDTDYTAESILQLSAEPLYQSITDSFSSLNSDVPENFLKKVAFHDTYTNAANESAMKEIGDNRTFECNEKPIDETPTPPLTGTYLRKSRTSTTFRMADVHNGTITLDRKSKQFDTTAILDPQEIRTETPKRLLDRRPSPSLDLNRLSYMVEDKTTTCDNMKQSSHSDQLNSDNLKRNSLGSTDSTDNLDYMSLSSGSSRSGSQKLDGLNSIVEMQERMLRQAISTPKYQSRMSLMSMNNISPIRAPNSDSELSSSELHKEQPIKKQKSLGNIAGRSLASQFKRTNPMTTNMPSNLRGSVPNLKSVLRTGSRTNLNSMGHTLKGSYTNLKPINPNLPVAPPLDATITLPLSNLQGSTSNDAQFVKPLPPKMSGLPRPVSASTGIPRPSSRIPGPTRSIPRPAQATRTTYR